LAFALAKGALWSALRTQAGRHAESELQKAEKPSHERVEMASFSTQGNNVADL
jgi:hypothetical protein